MVRKLEEVWDLIIRTASSARQPDMAPELSSNLITKGFQQSA